MNQKEHNADRMETKHFVKHDSLIALMMFGLVTVVTGFDLAHWFCCFSYATTAATINSGAGIQGSPQSESPNSIRYRWVEMT